ncbi:beta-ketoacyl synthase N-terminal-like domain-containing protein, partial [Xanthomonas arboricola]|uniref:beta-ketoacyl synthase N-terminal-like domain-containing protein n=1 Tax=Xanthomonas arboricola TaxID=56448 RepID=UPI0017AD20AD
MKYPEFVLRETMEGRLTKSQAMRLLAYARTPGDGLASPHPLLQQNTSDLLGLRFTTRLTGEEPFLADHVVGGRKMLPGVVALEMAMAAVAHGGDPDGEGKRPVGLRDVAWLRPVVADGDTTLHVELGARGDGDVDFDIVASSPPGERVAHVQGRVLYRSAVADDESPVLDLDGLLAACARVLDADTCYVTFAAAGIDYGPTHRGLQEVHVGTDAAGRPFALARIALHDDAAGSGYSLRPGIMDSALQAAIALLTDDVAEGDGRARARQPMIPFALDGLDVFHPVPTTGWAYLRPSARGDSLHTLDVDLCDASGRLCVRFNGLASRAHGWAAAPVDITAPIPLSAEETAADGDTGELHERTAAYLKDLLSRTLRLPPTRIDARAPLEHYGIDSILALQLVAALQEAFGSLPKTLMFEYQSIDALAGYFIERHRPALVARLPWAGAPAPLAPTATTATPVAGAAPRARRLRFADALPAAAPVASAGIAIVGMSGRYPQAVDLDAYWDNLRAGRDSITPIPAQRWDLHGFFDPHKGTLGRSYSKWGGFIDDVDRFDALFFQVSPREAQFLDPQERLFLECAYATLEDAGYTRDTLHGEDDPGGAVGVFVGVMYEEYQLYGAQAQALGEPFALGGSASSIANRVSYYCNLHGPSLAVDTMCSSSLTAIHLACRSLQAGECQAAIAGGVNVSVHPNKYLAISQAQFASSRGRCESFGAHGDGYVPGEGVGAVLLKPLERAIAAGDHIHGVILGSGINHGGKTNG